LLGCFFSTREIIMANIALFGLDIGKRTFHLVGHDAHSKPVFKRQFTRTSLIDYLAQHPACRIVMEACCGAHWLARKLAGFGHQVQLIAPQVCSSLRHWQQERLPRCPGHLRSSLSTQYALRRH
jgi:hypothetical protein